ncbi:condensation domain-containing protein [Streptomyces sp. MB09-02B]|uniref:condensation domain-containing protein n=1 Tax=Streptomyces sp. MB09-02B TaxID=3028667 RepID=UPI0029BB2933|nr:condensation domain-containing protein [Streptomyces sp. MB09-02B]MDX3638439.1 condensation domain-containing protein [Streptomyces sp. MB09-02B]
MITASFPSVASLFLRKQQDERLTVTHERDPAHRITSASVPGIFIELPEGKPAPVTWGQRAIWDAMADLDGRDQQFNLSWVISLPASTTPLAVHRAVSALVQRHESLRSVYGKAADGTVWYRPLGPVRIPVRWLEASDEEAGEVAEKFASEMKSHSFRHESEPPLRIAVVGTLGNPRLVAFVVSHLVADFEGLRLVERELIRLLEKDSLESMPSAPTLLELTRLQRSERGRREAERSINYWVETLRKAPPMSTDPALGDLRSPRHWKGSLVSRALPGAVGVLTRESRVSSAAVVLAGVSWAVGRYTGTHQPCLMVMFNNRLREPYRSSVSPVALEGLFTVDTSGADLIELARRAAYASLSTYRYAQYSKPELLTRIEDSGADHTPLNRACWFNDLRTNREPLQPAQAEDLEREIERSVFRWVEQTDAHGHEAITVHLAESGDRWEVTLSADTAVLGPRSIQNALRELELAFVEAARNCRPEPHGAPAG